MPGSFYYGGGYTLDYPITAFSFYKENGFDRIKAPKFCLPGKPGTPELPAVYLNYIIPPNAKAESIIVSQFQFVQIPGEYYIYPTQPPRVIGESLPWVPPDTLVYNSDEFFPGNYIKIISEGVMDGARIVTVEVCPLQYRPKTKRLFIVRQISFDFAFGTNTLPELKPHIRGKYEQLVYDRALAKVVVNDYEIPAYYQKPTLVDEATLTASNFAPGVIITPDWFKPYFLPYANWLTDQGLPTVIISPDWIYQHFSGCDNAEKIRNYIKYCYMEWCGTYDTLAHGDLLISDTCIADGFVDTYADKGACAYLGNTRDGQFYYADVGPSHTLQHNFYDVVFTQNNNPMTDNALSRLGVAEALSKSLLPDTNWLYLWRYRYVCYSHNLFGSPYTEVWTNIPRNLIVFHPIQIPVGQQTQFRVRVRDATTNSPVPYAKVCLNKPEDIYLVGQTDVTGWVTFIITPQTAGTLKVTVTRSHNLSSDYIQYYPSRTTCQVGWPEGGQSSGSDELIPNSLCITNFPTLAQENLNISYGIPEQGEVLLTIYDITGSMLKLKTLTHQRPGYYEEMINSEGLSNGIYFLVLKQNNEQVSRKFLLIK